MGNRGIIIVRRLDSACGVPSEVEVRLFCMWIALGGGTQEHTCVGVRIQQEEGRKADGKLSQLLQGRHSHAVDGRYGR